MLKAAKRKKLSDQGLVKMEIIFFKLSHDFTLVT